MTAGSGQKFALVWDKEDDGGEVFPLEEARGLDGDRYELEFVFDSREEAEEYVDA